MNQRRAYTANTCPATARSAIFARAAEATGAQSITFTSNTTGNVTLEISSQITGSGSYGINPYIDLDNVQLSWQQVQTTSVNNCTGVQGYRYGFNNQEKDNEVYGEGNSTTAEFWQYDARLGRRWNVDPVVKEYYSSYLCFGGDPIGKIDINGDNEGDYYSRDGYYIGNDGVNDNKVIVVDSKKDIAYQNKKDIYGSDVLDLNKNPIKSELIDFEKTTNKEILSINHTQFQKLAGFAAKEDFSSNKAIYATANAQKNRFDKYLKAGWSWDKIFNFFNQPNADTDKKDGLHGYMLKNRKKYKEYWNTPLEKRNSNSNFVDAQKGVINAWSSCGFDYSNGATGWDGVDWQIKGYPAYNRMYQKGFIWSKKALIDNNAKYNPENNPNSYIKDDYEYEIMAAYGKSIYWRPVSKKKKK